MKRNVKVEERAKVVKILLEDHGAYEKTGIKQVDMFLNFLSRDIQFLKSKLCWAKNMGESGTFEYESDEAMVEELALLGYRFVKHAFRNENKPITLFYMHMSLKQLGKFEKYLYSKPSKRKDATGLWLGKKAYFGRLEMLGLDRSAIMEISSLKCIADIITKIELASFPRRDSYIAALIVAAQDYVVSLLGNKDVEEAEEILASRVQEVVSHTTKMIDPKEKKLFIEKKQE